MPVQGANPRQALRAVSENHCRPCCSRDQQTNAFHQLGRQSGWCGVLPEPGVRSRDLAKQLGDRVNIYPVKGYSITVNLKDAASQANAAMEAESATRTM